MKHFFTKDRNHQILIALLKAHNIKNIVASPGVANSVFVGSIQHDDFFKIVSCVDERSAAYMACGIAMETGEPVVITCTGATAARNYMPGATEAFYSKLPILIITSSQPTNRIGHLAAQVTDRTCPPKDTCTLSVELPHVDTKDDEWFCEIQANRAILELKRHGVGPVHINLITGYSFTDEVALTEKNLPPVRVINRLFDNNDFPELKEKTIGIFVGSHKKWSSELSNIVEKFCENNNAVVFCDHTSNYHGKYKIFYPLVINQSPLYKEGKSAFNVDILIHIGEITGEENAAKMIRGKETWRVSEDGEIRDYFRNLTYVFEMKEEKFFSRYLNSDKSNTSFFNECISFNNQFNKNVPEQLKIIPFSNVWIAQKTASFIPENSVVVLSILNTLRTWNYAEFDNSIDVFCPVGGFGIDGATSILIGASLNNPEKLYFGISGDLAFFYDLNSLGNRHIRNNIRILLINNGCGVEFKKTYSLAYRLLEDEVGPFVSAEGHYGNQSPALVKNYSEALGFKYISASSKEEFNEKLQDFVNPDKTDKPIIFECFVDAKDEAKALDIIHNRI